MKSGARSAPRFFMDPGFYIIICHISDHLWVEVCRWECLTRDGHLFGGWVYPSCHLDMPSTQHELEQYTVGDSVRKQCQNRFVCQNWHKLFKNSVKTSWCQNLACQNWHVPELACQEMTHGTECVRS